MSEIQPNKFHDVRHQNEAGRLLGHGLVVFNNAVRRQATGGGTAVLPIESVEAVFTGDTDTYVSVLLRGGFVLGVHGKIEDVVALVFAEARPCG